MRVFIVEGSTGEYSDHIEWQIAAYLDESLAQEHVRLADEAYRVWLAGRKPISIDYDDVTFLFSPYDVNMLRMGYNGLQYRYYPVELCEALPVLKPDQVASAKNSKYAKRAIMTRPLTEDERYEYEEWE